MSVTTYDPQDVNVVVNGTIITGFMDGTFINVERDEESFFVHVGAKGEVTRTVNANKLGRITITLKQDSPSNSFLSRLANSKETFPVSVVDQNFNTNAGGNDAWVERPANLEYAKELTSRQWIIVIPELDMVEG